METLERFQVELLTVPEGNLEEAAQAAHLPLRASTNAAKCLGSVLEQLSRSTASARKRWK